ncbi:ABC transporter ATP-binding protein [Limnohabitans sp. WS1]|uniref:ABC transporter ATP-binding protein n=1 Tax=Limnohabitans sp. WS1 TaxID=1100726 RepID=UPI000D391030|nr:ABC transporter ATP-binding protein [Limnohabitans sp. WS1]PUE21476.1 Fe3+/spermidine/putrescine ABC transporter ATP-binding protein [Limnohabitans sp. WS1]
MSFLTLTNLSKFYGTQCAVDKVNLSVEKGEFVTLLGPSGCGKTTTLQMMAGFVEASEGDIFLDGQNITHKAPNTRGLGIVFQSYALFPHMTVAQNLSFGLEMRSMAKAERVQRVASALALVHLSDLAQRYPRELSGGQRQRVALARALVIEPPVLLLDEPLSNLDAKLREEMQFELRQIQRKVGTTTIMVTHDQTEAMSLSDRVVVMQAGRVTQIDKPYALYENPQTPFISTFVGKANLLHGQVKNHEGDCCIDMQGLKLPVAGGVWAEGQTLMVSVRPEKIQCAAPGTGRLEGTVKARFFLGSQWLYQIETALGLLTVTCANNESLPLHEGQITGLDWSDAAMRVLP